VEEVDKGVEVVRIERGTHLFDEKRSDRHRARACQLAPAITGPAWRRLGGTACRALQAARHLTRSTLELSLASR
jgi:hypothetical protein